MQRRLAGEACQNAPPSPRSISLILPAWNEAGAISRAITDADIALRGITSEYEIIVVDDGSDDETSQRTQEIAAMNPAVRLVRHARNRGYGAALKSGFAAARYNLVAFTDADNQFELSELDRFVFLSKDYQVVCGYRIDRKDSALRCLYSRVYNQLVRGLLRTGVRDIDCALKLFHRDALQALSITTDGFLVNTEILTQARQQNFSIVEVGVSHRPRTEGSSTVSAAHIPSVLSGLLRYWWNQVQFPGSDRQVEDGAHAQHMARTTGPQYPWMQVVLLLVAAIMLLSNLGYPLIDRDETRYAEIPREMLVTGNWVLPQLNFRPYYDKPPLMYWLCGLSYSMFGVSAWSARLVPAVSAMATLMATMWFGNRIFGRPTGLAAAAVLFLSVGFWATSRILLIDGLLACFVTLSLFSAYEAIRGPTFRVGWWTAASTACGVAFLSKGPIALVLFVPPVFAYAWLTAGASRPRLGHGLILAGIVALMTGPWLVAVSLSDPAFPYEFFYKHHVTRFAGAFHQQPFWYFVPVLLVAGHPWSFLTIPFAGYLFSHSEQSRRGRPPALGFLLLWSGWCFAFFSISKCKLPSYILPAFPAMALMIGHYLEKVNSSSSSYPLLEFARTRSWRLAVAATCVAGLGLGGFALLTNPSHSGIAVGAMVIWAIVLTVTIRLRRIGLPPRIGWSACAVSTLLLAAVVLHFDIPRFAEARTVFGPSSPLAADMSAAIESPIATVAREWSGIPFYLNRADIQNFPNADAPDLLRFAAQHGRILFVLRKDEDLAALRDRLPAATRLAAVGERGPARLVLATFPDGEPVRQQARAVDPVLH